MTRRTAGRWSGQVRGCESGLEVGGEWVRNGRGGQGGSPRHPPAHIACKSVKRARTFCAAHKSLAACADLLPLACFPGSECGVTPLPQFPRPSRPQCLLQPAAARVKFRYLPTHPRWAIFYRCTTLASQQHNKRPTTLARQREATWRRNSSKGKRTRSGQKSPRCGERRA